MDSTTIANTASSQETKSFPQQFGQFLSSPQLGSLIAMAAAITLGIGLIMSAQVPDYTPVFEQMDGKDTGQITELLNGTQHDYKIDPATGVILVPRKSLAQIRIQLAAAGLGKPNNVGLELLQQENSLGTSQFMETARYQHALETELSRTISSMRNIKNARVHLAMPKQSVFIRDRAKASASIMVQPMAGRLIEPGQVASIVNLVASSIPYLESNQVTVVDQWGQLLSKNDDGSGSDLTRQQFEYTRKLERLLSKRIETLLTPIVGEGNLRTSVTADIDFTVNEQTQELYEPDPTQIRSEETNSTTREGSNVPTVGVPGALTNQPNGAVPTPIPRRQANTNVSSQSVRNFELDKTIRHTRQSPSTIRRLSAAIIINHRTVTNEEGEIETVPIDNAQIEQLTALAKEAMGFDEVRGDSVSVLNQTFQPLPTFDAPDPLPIWQQPWAQGMVKQVFAGLAVVLLILFVVRPAMKNLNSQNQQLALTEAEEEPEDTEITPAEIEHSPSELPPPTQLHGDILNVAREMAKQDPVRVARVVKEWVAQ